MISSAETIIFVVFILTNQAYTRTILEEPRGHPVPEMEPLFQFSKSYNLLIQWVPMAIELEEIGRNLLHVLYDNYDSGKYYTSSVLSNALELDEPIVQHSLDTLSDSELLLNTDKGYRLSEKGYSVAYQRATSYCPHL
ncbi:hypothetical protein DRO31_00415 [Candidatus Bathyarchaeota archaeon]|nr:MAG: hypothetical protein DRO31_00415 [Candidatus Bathyarchaeota archaeon]